MQVVPSLVVIHCPAAILGAKLSIEQVRNDLRAVLKRVLPAESDAFATVNGLVYRVVTAPSPLTLGIAAAFLPNAKELFIDSSALNPSDPNQIPSPDVEIWLQDLGFAQKRMDYHDRNTLNYIFNTPPNKTTVAVVTTWFYYQVAKKSGSPKHLAAEWMSFAPEPVKEKIKVDWKSPATPVAVSKASSPSEAAVPTVSRGDSFGSTSHVMIEGPEGKSMPLPHLNPPSVDLSYLQDENLARVHRSVLKDVRELVREKTGEKGSPKVDVQIAVTEIVTKALSEMRLQIESLPTGQINVGRLDDGKVTKEVDQYVEKSKELMSLLAEMQEAVRRW